MSVQGACAMRPGATMRAGKSSGPTAASRRDLTPRRSALFAPLARAGAGGSNRCDDKKTSFSSSASRKVVARFGGDSRSRASRLVVRADGGDDTNPAVEEADPVAERAGIESGGLTDLMAQLSALQNENSKLQEDIETTKSIIASVKPPPEETAEEETDPAMAGIEAFFNQPQQKPREPIGPGELLSPPDEAAIKWPEPNENPKFWERPPIRMPENLDPKTCEITTKPLHVVHVTAEMAPVAKVGGLGDVVTGLARANMCLARARGCE